MEDESSGIESTSLPFYYFLPGYFATIVSVFWEVISKRQNIYGIADSVGGQFYIWVVWVLVIYFVADRKLKGSSKRKAIALGGLAAFFLLINLF